MNTPDSPEIPACTDAAPFRSAWVALVGRPNSGKSTLLNTIIQEPLSIVTPMPQTTRRNLKGIHSDEHCQLVFIDTPGLHDGRYSFNRAMTRQGSAAMSGDDVDIIAYLIDCSRNAGTEEDFVAGLVSRSNKPTLLIFTKIDLITDVGKYVAAWQQRYPACAAMPHVRLNATDPQSRGQFLEAIMPLVPPGPPYFPIDDLTDENMRFFAAEFIRKQIIALTSEEVPHAAFVEIDDYREEEERHRIEATIHVETTGQRGIIIGRNGGLIKKIQYLAARELSSLVETRVTIRCHLKITPNWRDDPAFLRRQGYVIDNNGR